MSTIHHGYEVEDEDLYLILSSNVGKSSGNPISLIKDDDFCSEARQFVIIIRRYTLMAMSVRM